MPIRTRQEIKNWKKNLNDSDNSDINVNSSEPESEEDEYDFEDEFIDDSELATKRGAKRLQGKKCAKRERDAKHDATKHDATKADATTVGDPGSIQPTNEFVFDAFYGVRLTGDPDIDDAREREAKAECEARGARAKAEHEAKAARARA